MPTSVANGEPVPNRPTSSRPLFRALPAIAGPRRPPPSRRVVERRIALVEGHDAVGCRELRNDGDVGVAADLVDEIARRELPPVDLAAAQRGRGRKRIQGQPLDPLEMRHLRTGGEADRAGWPRLILGKS